MLSPIKLAGRKIALSYSKYTVERLALEFDIAIGEHDSMPTVNKIHGEYMNACSMLDRVKEFYGVGE